MVVMAGKLYRRKRRGIRPEEIKTPVAVFRTEILLCYQVIKLAQRLCQRHIQRLRFAGQVIAPLSADKQRVLK